jgi:hypothetical protein
LAEDKKIKSIRHVMRPSVSYGYNPSFEKYYDTYALDASGTTTKQYSLWREVYGPGLNNSNDGVWLVILLKLKWRDRQY